MRIRLKGEEGLGWLDWLEVMIKEEVTGVMDEEEAEDEDEAW